MQNALRAAGKASSGRSHAAPASDDRLALALEDRVPSTPRSARRSSQRASHPRPCRSSAPPVSLRPPVVSASVPACASLSSRALRPAPPAAPSPPVTLSSRRAASFPTEAHPELYDLCDGAPGFSEDDLLIILDYLNESASRLGATHSRDGGDYAFSLGHSPPFQAQG
ncbi:hypothetical protein ZWY2020_009183 [Hordeum vulgare]|nr:hypothetical protein ZWY2020_009183 [Hordeum vulgare]